MSESQASILISIGFFILGAHFKDNTAVFSFWFFMGGLYSLMSFWQDFLRYKGKY